MSTLASWPANDIPFASVYSHVQEQIFQGYLLSKTPKNIYQLRVEGARFAL